MLQPCVFCSWSSVTLLPTSLYSLACTYNELCTSVDLLWMLSFCPNLSQKHVLLKTYRDTQHCSVIVFASLFSFSSFWNIKVWTNTVCSQQKKWAIKTKTTHTHTPSPSSSSPIGRSGARPGCRGWSWAGWSPRCRSQSQRDDRPWRGEEISQLTATTAPYSWPAGRQTTNHSSLAADSE